MPTETVTVHPSGQSLAARAQAWYLRDKQQWKWKDIRAEVRNVQPYSQPAEDGGPSFLEKLIAGMPKRLEKCKANGRRALGPPRANACMCMWRQHLVPGPQRARRQQSRPQSPSTGCIKF
jgi:hypothetical protein